MRAVRPLLCCLVLAGCRNATLFPNTDGTLNKPAKEFADDAQTRFPYPATLDHVGAIKGLAEIGYDANVINLGNYSGAAWTDVDLWVNKQYVLHLATVESDKAKLIPFKLFYNDSAQHFPENGTYVKTLELKKDGVIYAVPTQIGG